MKKSGFGVIDVDSGGDVHGADEAKAVDDSGTLQGRLDVFRDVDEGVAFGDSNEMVFGVMKGGVFFYVGPDFVSEVSGAMRGIEEPLGFHKGGGLSRGGQIRHIFKL